MIAEALNPDYVLERDRDLGECLKMIIVVGNRPMFDHVHGEGVIVRDKRLAIDVLLIRRDIRQNNCTLRWVETRQMLSDALTKMTVPLDFLHFVLR